MSISTKIAKPEGVKDGNLLFPGRNEFLLRPMNSPV